MFRRKLPLSAIAFFGLAIACGSLTVLVMQGYARRVEARRPDLGTPVTAVVVTQDLVRGTTLTAEMLRDQPIPAGVLPPDATPADGSAVGRVLAADVASGEVLTSTRLAGSAVGPVAAVVPDGLRAFLVPSGLPVGTVVPGDVVDVLGTFGGGRPHVETVAEGVPVARVLAPRSEGPTDVGQAGGPVLVLLVDPSTAEDLAYAAAFATLVMTVQPPVSTPSPTVVSP